MVIGVFCGGFAHAWCWIWSEERLRWQVCTLTGHSDFVRSVAFSADGKRVISGSDDKLVKIWNSKTGAEVGNPGECTRCCDVFLAFGDGCTRVLA